MVVGVHVRDINDNDPVLLNLPHNTSVREGAPVHTSVARVRAEDADSGRNALLTYNITAGNLDGAFYINDTVRKTVQSYEMMLCCTSCIFDLATSHMINLSISPLRASVRSGAGEQASRQRASG